MHGMIITTQNNQVMNTCYEIIVKKTLNESTYRRSEIVSPSLSVSIESVSENVEFNTSSSSLNNESTNISIIYMKVRVGKIKYLFCQLSKKGFQAGNHITSALLIPALNFSDS